MFPYVDGKYGTARSCKLIRSASFRLGIIRSSSSIKSSTRYRDGLIHYSRRRVFINRGRQRGGEKGKCMKRAFAVSILHLRVDKTVISTLRNSWNNTNINIHSCYYIVESPEEKGNKVCTSVLVST